MAKKLTIGILFGGKSSEHKVSLMSAKNVMEAIDKDKFNIIPIGIDTKGAWWMMDRENFLWHSDDPKKIRFVKGENQLMIIPGKEKSQIVNMKDGNPITNLDVIFPVMHGNNCEDGTLQGMLKLLNIPYVGPDHLGSSVGMDKDFTKRLLKHEGLPVSDGIVLHIANKDDISYHEIIDQVGLPFFIKPANAGSSVGVFKIKSKEEYHEKLDEVFKYDTKILIEEEIKGKEIEFALLGNYPNIQISLPGEIIPNHEFYSYDAKYIDDNGANMQIPAKIPEQIMSKMQFCAIRAFNILGCEGLSRVDFFLRDNGDFIINEINTLPGFTKISMYPKLIETIGVSYSELISNLIDLALERFNVQKEIEKNLI